MVSFCRERDLQFQGDLFPNSIYGVNQASDFSEEEIGRSVEFTERKESSSKKKRMDYDSGCDRISELPASIVDSILSLVSSNSTREAVRLSMLSKQYRDTWTSLTELVFDLPEFSSIECMDKFVTNVLNLHKGPIHKFAAFLNQSWPTVDKWLLLLPADEIRELNLKMESRYNKSRGDWNYIVYSFNNLTHLELHKCDLGPPTVHSTFTGFVLLKCLILVDVYISLSLVEIVVASSPLLEMLKLYGVWSGTKKPELRVRGPNLKCFDLRTYLGDCMQIYFSAPFLAEMCVSVIGFNDGYLRENCSTYNYTNFFGFCTSLRILKGNYFTKVLSYGVDSCIYSFVLPCLEVIELIGVKFGVVKQMSIVACLVTGAPNLQNLKLTCDPSKEKHASEAPDVSYMKFLRAPSFKWEKLSIITMRYLTGLPTEMEFLKLLLENSPALERMNIYISGLNFQESENLRAELLKCNLASLNFTLCISE